MHNFTKNLDLGEIPSNTNQFANIDLVNLLNSIDPTILNMTTLISKKEKQTDIYMFILDFVKNSLIVKEVEVYKFVGLLYVLINNDYLIIQKISNINILKILQSLLEKYTQISSDKIYLMQFAKLNYLIFMKNLINKFVYSNHGYNQKITKLIDQIDSNPKLYDFVQKIKSELSLPSDINQDIINQFCIVIYGMIFQGWSKGVLESNNGIRQKVFDMQVKVMTNRLGDNSDNWVLPGSEILVNSTIQTNKSILLNVSVDNKIYRSSKKMKLRNQLIELLKKGHSSYTGIVNQIFLISKFNVGVKLFNEVVKDLGLFDQLGYKNYLYIIKKTDINKIYDYLNTVLQKGDIDILMKQDSFTDTMETLGINYDKSGYIFVSLQYLFRDLIIEISNDQHLLDYFQNNFKLKSLTKKDGIEKDADKLLKLIFSS